MVAAGHINDDFIVFTDKENEARVFLKDPVEFCQTTISWLEAAGVGSQNQKSVWTRRENVNYL